MLRPNHKQTNFYSSLYDRIPENHLLKRIEKAVDFSFINKLLADSYCATFGRPAKEPELMAKLCILERLYNLSDVKVIEEANCNLAFGRLLSGVFLLYSVCVKYKLFGIKLCLSATICDRLIFLLYSPRKDLFKCLR